jgi:HEAT repeat protein
MVIEWAPMLSVVLKPVVGKLAVALATGAKNKIWPGELERSLGKALGLAEQWDGSLPASQHLFYHCDDKQVRDFWARVPENSLLLGELRKPIENKGSPDLALLQQVFERVAGELGIELVKKSLPGWIGALVECYVNETGAVLRFLAAREGYIANLRRRVDDVKFVGIDVPGEEVEKQGQLERIFVMPEVKTEERRSGYVMSSLEKSSRDQWLKQNYDRIMALPEGEKVEWQREEREPKIERLGADRIFSDRRQRRAVILGKPGTGKSTLVNYYALMVCTDRAAEVGLDGDKTLLPVVIRLRDWALRSQESLLDYCRWLAEHGLGAGKESSKLPPGFFDYWWERGQVLLLLDGLDEVANEGQRQELVERIEAFVGDDQQNLVLITSRPVGYRRDFFGDKEFVHYELEEFDRARIDLFIDHWYDSRIENIEEAKERKADLRSALERKGSILQLAKNPLLITIIVLIHRYQADLPRQRHRLYEKAVATFLTTWDLGNKRQGKELQLQSKILQSDDDWLYVMKKVAYHVHRLDEGKRLESGTLIGKDDLIKVIGDEIRSLKDCSLQDAKTEAKGFLQFIKDRTGLLLEQGLDTYGFVHKTFQEYLAAEEIHGQMEAGDDEIVATTIREYLHQPHWREVLLLLVARLKGRRAALAIREILTANSDYEKWLHRDLLFAGWCLTEDSEGLKQADRSLVNEILQGLMELEFSGAYRKVGELASAELTQIFEGLAGTNFQRDASALLEPWSNTIRVGRVLEVRAVLDQSAEVILALLSSPNSRIRFAAAGMLGNIGSSDRVINALLPLCSDPDSKVRSAAARTLGKIGSGANQVINALLLLLSDPNSDVLCTAAKALGEIGSGADQVINALLPILSDPDNYALYTAAGALRKIESSANQVINASLPILSTPKDVRLKAIEMLGKSGSISDKALDALLSFRSDPNHYVSFRAEEALGKIGSASDKVIDTLLVLCSDPNTFVRIMAGKALERIGRGSDNAIDALLALLSNQKSLVRARATAALEKIGHGADQAINILLDLLSDSDSDVLCAAAEALQKIGSGAGQEIDALLPLLSDPNYDVRFSAVAALGKIGRGKDREIDALLALLSDSNIDVLRVVASGLGKIGRGADREIDALLALLSNPERSVRSLAAKALGDIGSGADREIDALRPLLLDSDSDVIYEAATAIGKFGCGMNRVRPLSDTFPVTIENSHSRIPIKFFQKLWIVLKSSKTLAQRSNLKENSHPTDLAINALLSLLFPSGNYRSFSAVAALEKFDHDLVLSSLVDQLHNIPDDNIPPKAIDLLRQLVTAERN